MGSQCIGVLSGKGGTGKTLVSVNLAAVAGKATYIDCDVEEPNGHLFWKPEKVEETEVPCLMPQVNEELCNGCRTCVNFCKFNALAYIGGKIKVFEDICHSCGGCMLFCPQKAITEIPKPIGTIQKGKSEEVEVVTGILDTGQASGVPIIKELIKNVENTTTKTFIDCPPGSACVVMESIQKTDYCVLVAEPTIFGAHNLAMVYELVKLFKKPYGVVLNKCSPEENPSEIFCMENDIPIIGRIPFDTELGTLNSSGVIVAREKKEYQILFSDILKTIEKEALANETTANSQW